MMGSGKSTIGPIVARCLGVPWIDLDELVGERTSLSIEELWKKVGEDGFRTLEAEALDSIGDAPSVVGCGGGVAEDERSRRLLRARGKCVYLRASPKELASRLWRPSGEPANAISSRPLLAGVTSESRLVVRLAEILSARSSQYESLADLVVDIEGRSPETIASLIVGWWGES